MKAYIIPVLLVVFLAVMTYVLQGCSQDDGSSSFIYRCETTSDSTKVCGDNEYQIY